MPGHSWRATLSDTTATAALALRSVCVKPRPRTRSMPRTPKYSGETNWYVTVDLPLAPSANAGAPAQPARPRGRNRGDRRLAPHHFEDGPAPLLVQDVDIDDIGRADAGIDRRCRPRAAQEDGSADEEQHGSGHLKRDERIPRAAGTGITHHLAANRPHQLEAGGLKRRRQREEQGRDHRAGHQEQRDAPVRWRHGETNVAEIRRPGARHRVDDGCRARAVKCRRRAQRTPVRAAGFR